MSGPEVAVIGGGVAGLSCARVLADDGFEVITFDKARKAGGRISTRRRDGLCFDHGAQYFTARDAAFIAQVHELRRRGVVEPWSGRLTVLGDGPLKAETIADRERFVGVPGMSGVARALAEGLRIEAGIRVESIIPAEGGRWCLRDDAGADLGQFQRVVIAVPAGQAVHLLGAAPQLKEAAGRAVMAPCISVMLAYDSRVDAPWDAAFVQASALSWVARNSSKPSRAASPDCWVLHGAPDWSEHHFDEDPQASADALVEAWTKLVGTSVGAPIYRDVHRWRYASVPSPLSERCLWDAKLGIGACGDWCGGPRVEGAWLSGRAMARVLLGSSMS